MDWRIGRVSNTEGKRANSNHWVSDDKTVLMGKEDRDLEACREETLFQEIILSPTGTMPPQILNYRCNEKQSLTSPTLTSSISRKVHPSRITIEPIDPTVQPQQTG
jgi:hypothetical protein